MTRTPASSDTRPKDDCQTSIFWWYAVPATQPRNRKGVRMPSRFLCVFVAIVAFTPHVLARQDRSPDGAFELLKGIPAEVASGRPNVRPERGQAVRVHWDALFATLHGAPMEAFPQNPPPVTLTLPMPDGSWSRFAVVESPIMEPELAARFPGIRTYAGQGLDDPTSTVRLDYTPHGFHAQVLSEFGSWYVDPCTFGDTSVVVSYWKRDLRPPEGWRCLTDERDAPPPPTPGYADRAIVDRKTYRLAVAATGEYTAFHGGTQALGQAAIVTAINRVNQIYERDLAVRFTLVANNANIVYTNAVSDPYSNSASSEQLDANQSNIDSVIQQNNYDVGHLFCTGSGGIAQLSSACVLGSKARGISGSPSPVNDPFVVDYVAHEMGHQFAGRHCFNNCDGSAGDLQTYAYEPGSGATIMAYAGICGPTNLQSNSDAMFHSGSLDLMAAFVAGNTCPTTTSTGNNTPTVSGPGNFTIPRQTPFTLTATGSDIDGDALTYSWEQRDTASGVVAVNTDNGTNPIQRTWLPASSPARTIPRLQNLLNNTTAFGEILPQVGRTLNYRVVARDNRSGGGGIATANVVLTVAGTAGPFRVTSPNTGVAWSGVRTVTWDVASTNVSPVNCSSVRILLSTDGGNTFPTTLVASTPNDGSESVTLPNISTTQARIKVEAIGNIFFDISDVNFTITPASGVNLTGTGVNAWSDAAPNGNNNTRIDPGESSIALTVQVINTGASTATGVTGTLSSLTPTASVVSGSSPYPNLAPGTPQINSTPYIFAVSPAHPCGSPISLRLQVSSAQGSGTYDFTLPTGTPGGTSTWTYSYPGPALAIPDNNSSGVNASVTVSGFTGTLTDVNLRFDGSTCTSTAGATTVGLNHTWVGDLVVTLRAPGGSPGVVVIDRPGVPATTFGNNGNNFCQTVLDDEGTLGPIENAPASVAPFSGSWTPNNPLSAFDGINPNGTWTLNVADLASADTGSLRTFSLILQSTAPPVCQPPLPSGCNADVNCDGSADGFDVEVMEQAVGGVLTNFCQPDADFNHDGSVDGFDVEAVEQVVSGAPCP
jgi:subtilisin-like proprotein convertase family protein